MLTTSKLIVALMLFSAAQLMAADKPGAAMQQAQAAKAEKERTTDASATVCSNYLEKLSAKVTDKSARTFACPGCKEVAMTGKGGCKFCSVPAPVAAPVPAQAGSTADKPATRARKALEAGSLPNEWGPVSW